MKLIFTILTAIVLFSSCQKVIDVDLNEGGANLVIDASYDATTQIVSAKLSYTTNYFDDNESPDISTAVVTVADQNGATFPLSYSGGSSYTFNGLTPSFGENYTLSVVQDGETYEATGYLAPNVPLDTLVAEFEEASAFGDEGYIVYLGIEDAVNQSDYYRALFTVNGVFLSPTESGIFYFNDDFTEDNYFTIPLFTERFQVGDTVDCELRSINESRNLYLSGLEDVIGGNAAAPTNPVSNWSNGALGFFNVFSQTKRQIIIQ